MLISANAMIIEGVVQNQQGVVSLKADRFEPLTTSAGDGAVQRVDISHDFH